MKTWDECDVWTQAMLIAYDQLRQYEESQEIEILALGRIVK